MRDERPWEEFELKRVRLPVTRFRTSCKAVDETGRRCTLMEHGPELDHSASGRPFRAVLAPGAQPRGRELDQLATAGGAE